MWVGCVCLLDNRERLTVETYEIITEPVTDSVSVIKFAVCLVAFVSAGSWVFLTGLEEIYELILESNSIRSCGNKAQEYLRKLLR